MSAVEPRMVPGRRPGPGRIAGFAVLLVLVSWGLGTFAAWPWAASEPGAALLRISLRHVSDFRTAVRISEEELARRPAHMRPTDPARPTTGVRADAALTVAIDGRVVLSRRYRPTGLRRDGPIYLYEELPVAPGRHRVSVRLADEGGLAGPRQWVFERELEFPAGRAPLLEFTTDAGWQSTTGT